MVHPSADTFDRWIPVGIISGLPCRTMSQAVDHTFKAVNVQPARINYCVLAPDTTIRALDKFLQKACRRDKSLC
jgi:hypothetical protein